MPTLLFDINFTIPTSIQQSSLLLLVLIQASITMMQLASARQFLLSLIRMFPDRPSGFYCSLKKYQISLRDYLLGGVQSQQAGKRVWFKLVAKYIDKLYTIVKE